VCNGVFDGEVTRAIHVTVVTVVYVTLPARWNNSWHTPGKSFHLQTLAASRLYFLKQLKRAGLSSSHLLHFDTTVIRPVLEYASPLWHPTLTKSQTECLEAVQRRALKIIFFVIPHPPRILLPWNWLVFYLFKQDGWISPSVSSKIFVNLIAVYTIFSHPRVT